MDCVRDAVERGSAVCISSSSSDQRETELGIRGHVQIVVALRHPQGLVEHAPRVGVSAVEVCGKPEVARAGDQSLRIVDYANQAYALLEI